MNRFIAIILLFVGSNGFVLGQTVTGGGAASSGGGSGNVTNNGTLPDGVPVLGNGSAVIKSGAPNLNGSYIPQPTSGAIDNGTSESAYFTTDAAEVTRPQGSAWDIGAWEYPAGQASPTAGNIPGSSTVVGAMR